MSCIPARGGHLKLKIGDCCGCMVLSATLSGSLQASDGINPPLCVTPVSASASDSGNQSNPCPAGGTLCICCTGTFQSPINYDPPTSGNPCTNCCGCVTDHNVNPDEGFAMNGFLYHITSPTQFNATFTDLGYWLILFPYLQAVCFTLALNNFSATYPSGTEDFLNGMAFFLGDSRPVGSQSFSWADSDMYNNTGTGLELIHYNASVTFNLS
jgi:hypothetical protein